MEGQSPATTEETTGVQLKADPDVDGWTVCGHKVVNGSFVVAGNPLVELKDETGQTKIIKAPRDGVCTFTGVAKKGAKLVAGMELLSLSDCQHDVVIKDMCASCGKDLREKGGRAGERREASSANVSMVHHVPELIVSSKLAKELGNRDREHLLTARKLVLLVDLDQTLVHTSNRPVDYNLISKVDGVYRFGLYGGTHITKIRPFTKEFLDELSPLYEMHIVSYGQRQYAHKIAEILDPGHKVFGERILSRDELFSAQHKSKNLRALFPSGEEFVTIIDDRHDVWLNSPALIKVSPYRYWREVGDINAPPSAMDETEAAMKERVAEEGDNDKEAADKAAEEYNNMDDEDGAKTEEKNEHAKDTLNVNTTVTGTTPAQKSPSLLSQDEDEGLIHATKVLKEVHAAFYAHYDATGEIKDVKELMTARRKEVLHGSKIVFSGMCPLTRDIREAPAYHLVIAFGGEVVEKVVPEVTCVVAARWGSQKVHLAVQLGVPVVSPLWIDACVEQFRFVELAGFELTKDSDYRRPMPLMQPTPPIIPVIDKSLLLDMENEVDSELADEEDDEEDGKDLGLEDEDDGDEDTPPKKVKDMESGLRRRALEDPADEEEPAKKKRRSEEEEEDGEGDEDVDYPDDKDDDDSDEDREDMGDDGNDDDDTDDEEFDDMAAAIERRVTESE